MKKILSVLLSAVMIACAMMPFMAYGEESYCEKHNLVVKSVVKPTCTKDGYTVMECTNCTYTERTNRVEYLGHSYKEYVKNYNRCDKADEEIRECTRCGLKQVMPLGPVTKHTMASKVTKNATYSATGVRTYYCTKCSYKYTKDIPKLTVSKPSNVSISAKSKSFVLKWSKNSKATGYQVQYSTSSSFKTIAKSYKITSNSTVSKTVKSLKGSKKYYVRIRCYKNYNGKTYYSSWVNKSVTTKK